MVKVTRVSRIQLLNEFGMHKVHQDIDTKITSKALQQQSMKRENLTLAPVENDSVITLPSVHTRSNQVAKGNLEGIPFTMTRSNVMDSSKNPSFNRYNNKGHHSQSNILQRSKLCCYCLTFMILFIMVMAIAAAVIAGLLSSKKNTTSSTPVMTTTSRSTTTTSSCSASSSYSDPCSGNPPTSKYILNSQVFCRQDATNTLVLGYYFQCGNYSSCLINSDCGQDGYCDQYCVSYSCGSFCNQGRGNCAKLATGSNCGVALS